MGEKFKIDLREQISFKVKNCFTNCFKMSLKIITKKYIVESAILFFTKSIIQPRTSTETIRQYGS